LAQVTDIKVDRLALDGDGIGRLSGPGKHAGEAAFVPYALPDETVRARLLVQKQRHSRWLPVAVPSPSPSRIDPPCPYHFKPGLGGYWCGGCNWQQMPAETQLQMKGRLLEETLQRLGGIPNPPVRPPIASPEVWRYRNKVQVPFGRAGSRPVAGFFAPGSHTIVEFEDCLVQPTPSVELVRFVRAFTEQHKWAPYEEDAGRGWLRHLLVRTNAEGRALVALVTTNPSFPDRERFLAEIRKRFPFVAGVHQNVQPARTNVILGERWIRLWGADRLEEKMLGLSVTYGAGSFFQINKLAAEKLYALAIEELGAGPESNVIDVYCGVGMLTLLAARKCRLALGIESVKAAIHDAEGNAERNGIRNAMFMTAPAETALAGGTTKVEMVASENLLVMVDPPRSGCEPAVVNALLRLNPARIVYVSCHPATLARDIKLLSSRYELASVTAVDLFPQTSHIEAVARLERRKA
jgi:23S rRNA (uracil1939-C5)-methyltransferase